MSILLSSAIHLKSLYKALMQTDQLVMQVPEHHNLSLQQEGCLPSTHNMDHQEVQYCVKSMVWHTFLE